MCTMFEKDILCTVYMILKYPVENCCNQTTSGSDTSFKREVPFKTPTPQSRLVNLKLTIASETICINLIFHERIEKPYSKQMFD